MSSANNKDSILFIDPWFRDKYVSYLKNSLLKSGFFDRIIILESIYDGRKKKEYKDQLAAIRKNMYELDLKIPEITKDMEECQVYTYSETKEIDQFIISSVTDTLDADFIHVEDGLSAYYSMNDSWSKIFNHKKLISLSPYHTIIHLLILYKNFQWRWERIGKFGDFENLNHTLALFPSHVRDNLKKHTLLNIPPKIEWENQLKLWVNRHLELYGTNQLNSIEYIFFLPFSVAEIDQAVINEYLSCLSSKSSNVAIKPHPKEKKEYWESGNLITIPQHIPAEFLYISDRINLESVIGFRSTALHSCRKFSPSTKVISLNKISGTLDEIEKFYNGIGIKQPDSIDDFKHMFALEK